MSRFSFRGLIYLISLISFITFVVMIQRDQIRASFDCVLLCWGNSPDRVHWFVLVLYTSVFPFLWALTLGMASVDVPALMRRNGLWPSWPELNLQQKWQKLHKSLQYLLNLKAEIGEIKSKLQYIAQKEYTVQIQEFKAPKLIIYKRYRSKERVWTMYVPELIGSSATTQLLLIAPAFNISDELSVAEDRVSKIKIDGVDRTGHTCRVEIKPSSVIEVWLR